MTKLFFGNAQPSLDALNAWLQSHAGEELHDEQKPQVVKALSYFREAFRAALMYRQSPTTFVPCILSTEERSAGRFRFTVRRSRGHGVLEKRTSLPSLFLEKQ